MGKLLIPNFKKGGRMLSRNKDTDYLALSARIHAMEGRLLTRDRMDRMIDAREESEALKVLTECGYGGAEGLRAQDVERVLATARAETFQELSTAAPDPRVVDVFRLKYDYHNAKVLVKAEAMGIDAGRLLLDGGRVPASGLAENYQKEQLGGLSLRFQSAIREARETLAASHDPQLADLALDRACYEEMAQLAREKQADLVLLSGDLMDGETVYRETAQALSQALGGIPCPVFLRAAVRVARMGKGSEFLSQVLLPGGSVSQRTLAAARGEELSALFQNGALAQAAELGAKAARPAGGSLTAFERECDNALTRYLGDARRVPFGVETVVAYLYAKEAELTAIRTILAGRRAGLDGAVIRERLRETYV